MDERFEDALRGDPPLSPDDDLGAFVRDVRDAFPAGRLLAEEVHVAAVTEAARTLSARQRAPLPTRSRAVMPRLRSRAAVVVAGLVVAMSSFGGLAVAGDLPDGVQNRLADIVNVTTGIDLPGGSDETADGSTDVENDADGTQEPKAAATGPKQTESRRANARGKKADDGESGHDDQAGQQSNAHHRSGHREPQPDGRRGGSGRSGVGSGQGRRGRESTMAARRATTDPRPRTTATT